MSFESAYCSTPYSLVMIQPDGSYRMCCLSNDSEYDMGGCMTEDGQLMNIFTHTLRDALNSKWHKLLREAHNAGERHQMCEVCYQRDDIEGNSRRMYVSDIIPQRVDGYTTIQMLPSILKNNEVIAEPIALDLRFGNLCNLKCVTCGPWYSDKWIEEYEQFYGTANYTFGGANVKSPKDGKVFNIVDDSKSTPWWESQIWWDRLDEVKPHLKHLYITGGEPMIVPAHDELLKRLVDANVAKNILIEIDTNLTALNPKVMEYWNQFKRIDLRISIDDVYDQYTYFRFPGKWSVMEKNIKRVMEAGADNVFPILTTCITPLNLFSIQQIYDFNSKMGFDQNPHFRYVEKPRHLDLRFLTQRQKEFAIAELEKQEAPAAARTIKYLQNNFDLVNVGEVKKFIRFFDFLDESRGLNWRQTYPLAAQMYNEEMIK